MTALKDRILKLDLDLSGKLAIWQRKSPLRTLASIITHSGDGVPVAIAYAIASIVTWGTPAFKYALLVFAADTVTFVIIQLMKWTFKRPRPEGTWGKMYRKIDPHSFPSGHSARGGTILVMALFLGPPLFTVLGVVWGIAVAISRVLMGVHYVSDMAVGFTIGAFVALLFGVFLVPAV